MFERRLFRSEVRAEGRRLTGTVLRYGDESPSHRERFEARALRLAETIALNLHHRPLETVCWYPDGALALRHDDTALRMVADVPATPAGDAALAMVRDGRARGLSVEFRAERERRETGVRVVERAELTGIGLVRSPSYEGSRVEARARSGRTFRSRIPADTDLGCTCSGKQCRYARFDEDTLAGMMRDAFDGRREVVASFQSYASPLASAGRGTLRGRMVDGAAEFELDVPTSAAGHAAVAAYEDAGVVIRPYLDADRSEGVVVPTEGGDNAMSYSIASLRAVIVSATDEREGWPSPELVATPDELASADAPRRPVWL